MLKKYPELVILNAVFTMKNILLGSDARSAHTVSDYASADQRLKVETSNFFGTLAKVIALKTT